MIDTYNYDIKYIEDDIVRRYNHPNNDYSDFDSLLSMRQRMKRFLGCDYPNIHPVQGKDRQELWNATLFLCINICTHIIAWPKHDFLKEFNEIKED